MIPEATANFFSILTFNWIAPLLGLGYARPLEATDLYKLQDDRGAERIADAINESFDRRVREANEYNARLANGEISPGLKAVWWTLSGRRKSAEKKWREETGRKKASLVLAMNDSVKWWFWSSGIFKVVGDTAQVTSPLLVKVCFPALVVVCPCNKNIGRLSSTLPQNLTTVTGSAQILYPRLERALA